MNEHISQLVDIIQKYERNEFMKRIICACLEQTNRFETAEEFSAYISVMERKNVKYKVIEKDDMPDGTVVAKIKKQYNHYDVGTYLD